MQNPNEIGGTESITKEDGANRMAQPTYKVGDRVTITRGPEIGVWGVVVWVTSCFAGGGDRLAIRTPIGSRLVVSPADVEVYSDSANDPPPAPEVGSREWVAERMIAVARAMIEQMATIREIVPWVMGMQSSSLAEVRFWTETHHKLDAMVVACYSKGCDLHPNLSDQREKPF